MALFCGKLYDWKQPLLLLDAFARVRRDQPCWLLFAGDGVQRPQLEATIARREIPNVPTMLPP